MSNLPYEPARIEPKWQAFWEEHQVFAARPDTSRPKYYLSLIHI